MNTNIASLREGYQTPENSVANIWGHSRYIWTAHLDSECWRNVSFTSDYLSYWLQRHIVMWTHGPVQITLGWCSKSTMFFFSSTRVSIGEVTYIQSVTALAQLFAYLPGWSALHLHTMGVSYFFNPRPDHHQISLTWEQSQRFTGPIEGMSFYQFP